MALYSNLSRLKNVYAELEEGFYLYGDYPMNDEKKYLNNNPHIDLQLFDQLTDIINELSDLLEGSNLIINILNLIEEDSPINNLVTFNEQDYADDLTSNNPASFDEEELNTVQEQSAQEAYEIKSDLFHIASEDIIRLMEDLLPLLIE